MTVVPSFVEPADLVAYRSGDADAALEQVEEAVRRYCGWHIAPSITETALLDGSGARSIALDSLYVTAVASVSNCAVPLDADAYDWSADGYIRLRNGCFTDRPRQVSVEFAHGYDEAPADLVGVIVGIADRVRPTGGNVREQAGAVSLTLGTFNGVAGTIAMLGHELAIIDKYRLSARP